MNGSAAGIRHRDPRLTREENNRVRTCHSSFVTNRYCGACFLQNKHLLGIVVFVKGNDGARLQNLRQRKEVFGVSILLVDLDDEFRNGSWTTGRRLSYGAAQPVLAVGLLENQRLGRIRGVCALWRGL